MKAVPYISGVNQDVVKEMAGSIHTIGLLTSKLKSSLEEGKKQSRVWIEYVCSVTKMLLYPSFRVPLVLLLSPYGDSEMARNGFGDGSKWYATGNTCSSVNDAGAAALRIYIHQLITL